MCLYDHLEIISVVNRQVTAAKGSANVGRVVYLACPPGFRFRTPIPLNREFAFFSHVAVPSLPGFKSASAFLPR